jgi:hypothetical protein
MHEKYYDPEGWKKCTLQHLSQRPRPPQIDDPICPRCGSHDIQRRRILANEFPGATYPYANLPRFVRDKGSMAICGCNHCDNCWVQNEGVRLPRDDDTQAISN